MKFERTANEANVFQTCSLVDRVLGWDDQEHGFAADAGDDMRHARQKLLSVARAVGVLPLLELVKFTRECGQTRGTNLAFQQTHPDLSFPPLWWMHDMYSHTRYPVYYASGSQSAAQIQQIITDHMPVSPVDIADWGCGLGRVIQHLPPQYQRSGFDVNAKAIKWCRKNLDGISFAAHGNDPPLPVEKSSFDFVYSISVLTHLPEQASLDWLLEILRVLRPGGMFLCSVHGASQTASLMASEQAHFAAGHPVFRGNVQVGSRLFTSYHPENYLRGTLFKDFEIVKGPFPLFGQEGWLLRRPSETT